MQYILQYAQQCCEIDITGIHFTDEETETQRFSVLHQVTEQEVAELNKAKPDTRAHAFKCSAIRVLPTALDLVKLELFKRDGWKDVAPPWVYLSQKQLGVG